MSQPIYLQAVPIFTAEDEAFDYFRDHLNEANALTGNRIHIIMPQTVRAGDSGDVYGAVKSDRYPNLRFSDLPCLWIEDAEYKFALKLPANRAEMPDALRRLAEAASEATSAKHLRQLLEKTDQAIPMSDRKSYALISIGLFAGALVVFLVLLAALPVVARYQFGAGTYLVYVLIATLPVPLLFGAMRSTGSLRGKKFGVAFEFGGPAALFAFLLIVGMYYERHQPPPQTFGFTIFFVAGDESAIVRTSGIVTLLLDRGEEWPVNNGEALPRGIPAKWVDQSVPITFELNGFKAKGGEKQYKLQPDSRIMIQVEKVKPATVPVSLKLVDLQIAQRGQFPQIDLKLRNLGDVALLKKANFHVEKVWEKKTGWLPGQVKASWNYDVLLPVLGAPYVVEVPLSQEVKRGDTDRFTFTVANDSFPTLTRYIYKLNLDLVYDEDDKVLNCGPILFTTGAAAKTLATNSGGDFIGAFRHNVAVAQEIGTFQGAIDAETSDFLKSCSPRRVADLVKQLAHPIPDMRRQAAVELGLWGTFANEAVAVLDCVQEDADAEVQGAASEAIARIRGASTQAAVHPVIDEAAFRKEQESWKSGSAKEWNDIMTRGPSRRPTTSERGLEMPPGASSAPSVPESWLTKGHSLFKAGKNVEAVDAFTKALEVGEENVAGIYLMRGRAYLNLRKWEEAAADCTKAIERVDGYHWTYHNRALAYRALGRFDEALADLNKAVSLGPNQAEHYIMRAYEKMRRGDVKGSLDDASAAVKRGPYDPWTYPNVAELYIIAGNYAEVDKLSTMFQTLDPEPGPVAMMSLFEFIAARCRGDADRRKFDAALGTSFELQWTFDQLDLWLSRAARDDARRSDIKAAVQAVQMHVKS